MNGAKSFWLPERASSLAGYVDGTFYGYLGFSVILFAIIAILVVLFILKHRNQPQADVTSHSGCKQCIMQTGWTAIILILLLGFSWAGLQGFVKLQVPPNNAIELGVTAGVSGWQFHYAGGTSPDSLVAPVKQPVRLVMSSKDNLHGIAIPAMRVGKGVIPNRKTITWFSSEKEGLFPIYNSRGGADAFLKIISQKEYDKWLSVKFDPSIGKTPEQYGRYVYEKQGCNACHSTDGTKLVGPTLKGLFGSERTMKDGNQITAGEDYLKKSITEPNADVAAGFDPTMQPYPLKDKQMNALIAYLKSIQ